MPLFSKPRCSHCLTRPAADGTALCDQCLDAFHRARQTYDRGLCHRCARRKARPWGLFCRRCLAIYMLTRPRFWRYFWRAMRDRE